jgi:hypothetical protein
VSCVFRPQGGGDVDLWGNRLHSFCIGLPGSPDLKAGAEVAKFLGTDHHEFTFTVQVGGLVGGAVWVHLHSAGGWVDG